MSWSLWHHFCSCKMDIPWYILCLFLSFSICFAACRMLNKVKLETHTFDIAVEDLDLLNQAVGRIEKLLGVGFFQVSAISYVWSHGSFLSFSPPCITLDWTYFDLYSSQWLLYKESCKAAIEQVKGNKRFIDGCFSCIHEGLLEVLSRHGNMLVDYILLIIWLPITLPVIFHLTSPILTILDTWKELPLDRWKILQYTALFIFSTHISGINSQTLIIYWKNFLVVII